MGYNHLPLPQVKGNETIQCKEVKVLERINVTQYYRKLSPPTSRSECEKKNYHFITIGRFKNVGQCHYDELRVVEGVREKIVWECQEKNKPKGMKGWDSDWTVSLLQKFQYGGNTSWCIKWQGKQNGTDQFYTVSRVDRSGRQESTKVAWWTCEKKYTCDSNNEDVEHLLPVLIALRAGCACRGIKYNSERNSQASQVAVDCSYSTIQSPGQFVWAASNGTWTTHPPIDGEVKEITLGLPPHTASNMEKVSF